MNTAINQQRLTRRIFKSFALLTMLGVLGIAVLFVSLWLEHRFGLTLPKPTGPFTVGRALYDWTDDKTLDTLAPVPGTKRELLVWMWYPAADSPSAVIADYLSAPLRTAIERQSGVLLSHFLTRDLSKVHAHSLLNVDVSSQQQSYPVVIMRAGASLEVASYATLAEDLASHGYVVVGVDAPYRTGIVAFSDGRVIKRTPENNPELCLERTGQERERCANRFLDAWNSDIAYVLDRLAQLNASDASGKFTGKLDVTRVGIFGHSFGGAQAAQFCSLDSRCKAGIDLDGAPHGSVIQAGINRPFMFLLSDHSRESDAQTQQIKADIQSIYDHIPLHERLYVTIRGANHFTFSDDGALLKSHLVRGVLRAAGKLGIDGDRQLAVTAYCLHTFFDANLKRSVSPLMISSSLYPEIQVVE
jgi:dienelactone hydrolase